MKCCGGHTVIGNAVRFARDWRTVCLPRSWSEFVCHAGFLKKPRLVFPNGLKNISPLYFPESAVFTCRVASSPYDLLPTSLLSSLLPVLARACTRQSCDTNARFARVLSCKKEIKYVPKDKSNWLSSGFRRIQSNKDHAVYSDFYR
jgi:hypothetical protein